METVPPFSSSSNPRRVKRPGFGYLTVQVGSPRFSEMSVNVHNSTQPIMSEGMNIQKVMAKVNDIFCRGSGTVVTNPVDFRLYT